MRKNTFRVLWALTFALTVVLVMSVFTSCTKNGPQYEIAFESNGGTMYYTVLAYEQDSIMLPTPTKDGYGFAGWYDNPELSGESLPDTYSVQSNGTLYAKWEPLEGVLKFESNGGTRYKDLQFYAQRIALPTPQKEGYIFGGWYTSKDFSGNSLGESFVPNGDMTIYAKWNIITGSVSFESNGGTRYNKVDTAGQKVKLPTPTKEGYCFAGWYDNPEFSGEIYQGDIVPNNNITLYARWAIGYTLVTLEENGGEQLDDIKLFDNDVLSLPSPSRWGYIFKGWYLNSDLNGEPVSDYFYYPASDVTLYAKWEKCSYLYLFYGGTELDWVRFEYKPGSVITLQELYSLITPDNIIITDYLGNNHVAPFMHWAYVGYDKTMNIKVSSNFTIEGDYLALVAEYDDSSVPPKEYLTYDKEQDIWTTTGKVAHQFMDAPAQKPYMYSVDLSFKKGSGGGVGPAFRMRVSDADYHYEGGCDYLAAVINPTSGSLSVSSVLSGNWSNLVSAITIESLPDSWQDKFGNTGNEQLVNVTVSIADYGTWFEIYIDNELAYTYTKTSKLSNYFFTGLGIRSSVYPVNISNVRVAYDFSNIVNTNNN